MLKCRANLDLLEGWACQVGFRDSILHYLARFSGAIDLLATSPNQLLEVHAFNLFLYVHVYLSGILWVASIT